LDGMIDFTLGKPADASPALLTAAKMCAAHDVGEARDTLLHAFEAAHFAGRFADVGLAEVLEAARAIQLDGARPTIGDALLEGFAALGESGVAVGVPIIRRALELASDQPVTDEELRWLPIAWLAAPELYDDRIWQAFTSRWAIAARMRGTVIALPISLGRIPYFDVVVGRFAAAERAVAEARELAAVTANAARPGGYNTAVVAALAWRGREAETRMAADTLITELTSLGRGAGIRVVHLSMAVLELGLGNYREALRAARKASADDPLLHLNAEPELVEAAVRCGELDVARAVCDRLSARAQASGTDWGLGLTLRSQALLADREDAEEFYRGAIELLKRTLILPQLGRTHLVYGEWLRRQRRLRDAREQLRTAFDLLGDVGADAFAERARIELLATGEHARRRVVETLDQLTPQEEQIARLASEGASNMDIAMQLFISVPTVVYHLQKAFRKLDITNRASLARALSQRDGGQGGGSGRRIGTEPRERSLPASGRANPHGGDSMVESLTAQELAIAQLAAAGLTNKQIGERLLLGHRTVANYLHRILPKLGVTTSAALRDALNSLAKPE
jgi:DNA-binding NarL/FixJ family response regulator